MVSVVYIAILNNCLKEYGIDTTEIMDKGGVSQALLDNPAGKIAATKMNIITSLSENAVPDPEFWFSYGEKLTIATHGTLGHALMACQNLGQVIDFFFRYYHIQMPMLQISRDEDERYITLNIDRTDDYMHESIYGAEIVFSALHTNLKILLNEDSTPLEFYINSPPPSNNTIYTKYLGMAVHFDNDIPQMRIPKSYLNHPIIFSNPVMKKYYAEQCERQLKDLVLPSDIIGSVTRLITATPGYFPAIDQVAEQLNVSERTLRRKLSEENSSYREILDSIKKQKAIEHLKNSTLTIEHIAHLLGYSDTANFRRAFFKWLGSSPAEYRKSLQN